MTQEQIRAHFKALQDLTGAFAGADLPEAERATVRAGVDSILQLVETVVLDINRIANSAELIGRL